MTGGTAVFKGALEGGYYELGSGKVILETPAGSSADAGTIKLIGTESDVNLGTANLTISQNTEGGYDFHGTAASHELSLEGGNQYRQSGKSEIKGMEICPGANFTLTDADVKINGNVCMEDDSADITSFTIEEGASVYITGNLITKRNSSGMFKQILITVRGSVRIDGDMENTGSLSSTMTIDGKSAEATFEGAAFVGNINAQTAVVHITGMKAGNVTIDNLSLERTEGNDPNVKIVYTDNKYHLSANAEGAPIKATAMTLKNGDYNLTSGTYSIANTNIGSNAVVDMNCNITFNGNLNVTNGLMQMTSDGARVQVNGNYLNASDQSHEGSLTAGCLSVSGNVTQHGSYANFAQSGNHVLELNGSTDQTITLESPQKNVLTTLEITNTAGTVIFASPVRFSKLFNHSTNAFVLYDNGAGSEFVDYDGDGRKDHIDIAPTDLTKSYLTIKIQEIVEQKYTGEAVTPEVIVTAADGTVLEKEKDYLISYTDNVEPGEGKVIVTGLGFYGETEELAFRIVCEHEYGDGVVTTPATEENEGLMTYICKYCGSEKTEAISKIGAYRLIVSEGNTDAAFTGGEERIWTFQILDADGAAQEMHNLVFDVSCLESSPLTIQYEREYNQIRLTASEEVFGEVVVTFTGSFLENNVEKQVTLHCVLVVEEKVPETETESESEPETEHEQESESKSETESEKESESESETESEKESESESETEYEQESEMESDTPELPCTQHRYGEWQIVKEATCGTEGERNRVCESCGYVETEGYFGEHCWSDYRATIEFPTCSEPGIEGYFCTNCGVLQEGSEEEIPMEPHEMGDWKVTIKATCTKKGEQEASCIMCGTVVSEEIPAVGHSYDGGKVTKKATTTAEGVKTYTCKNCKATKKEKIAKLPLMKLTLQKTVKGKNYTVTIAKTQVTGNGKNQKPKITVKYNNKTLKSKYYTVKYTANKYTGLATATVKGKGSYKSKIPSTKIQFVITPKKMKTPTVKAGKGTARITWKTEKQASGYQIQISASKKFKSGVQVINMKSGTKSKTVSGLTRKKTYYVRMRAYKTIQGSSFYGKWSSAKKVKIK